MLSVQQLKILEPQLQNLSDKEVEKARLLYYQVIELAFDKFISQKNVSKSQLRLLTNRKSSDII